MADSIVVFTVPRRNLQTADNNAVRKPAKDEEPKTRTSVLLVVCKPDVANFMMRQSTELLPMDTYDLTIDMGTPATQMPYTTFDVVVLDSGFDGNSINAHHQEARRQKPDLTILTLRFPEVDEPNFQAFCKRLLRNIDQWMNPPPAA